MRNRINLGMLMAIGLQTSWRASVEPLHISPRELNEITPLALASGCGPLLWKRVRETEASTSVAGIELQQAYRLSVLAAAVHERELAAVIGALNGAGVQSLLVKGWVAARLYSELGLRPYGDFDVCVKPEEYSQVKTLFSTPELKGLPVDIHKGLSGLDDLTFEQVLARSRLVKIGDLDARVPSPEDHLRILCMHMLKHGVWRPLWLCDIAAAMEQQSSAFEWPICLGTTRRSAESIICAIALAKKLLGACPDEKTERRDAQLPKWIVPTVLRQWSIPFKIRLPMASFVRRPLRALKEARSHWPNGIEASMNVRAPFNNFPRFPFQIGDCLLRAAAFLTTRSGNSAL